MPPDAAAPAAAPPLTVRRLGRVGYREAAALQAELVRDRREQRIADQLLLLEHDHVFTLGSSADPGHVLLDDRERARRGIDLVDTGRGGGVTYHGPGQLVGYPILCLEPPRRDLHRYIRDLEETLIRALADCGIAAGREPGLTGVWAAGEKIAAIGVRVSSGWITSHGFALNIDTDLGFFDGIIGCGIHDRRATSVSRLAPGCPRADVEEAVVARFAEVFGRRPSGEV